jgi:hypothetical protein
MTPEQLTEVKAMAKVYREGRLRLLAVNPDASEIETVEAGIEAVLKAIRAIMQAEAA